MRRRTSAGRAIRYTLATAPAAAATALATGWIYGDYTEFDRPTPVPMLPFFAGAVAWCIGATVIVARPARPGGRRLAAAGASAALAAAALFVWAPAIPLQQAAVLLVIGLFVPVMVLTILDGTDVAHAIVRGVVGGIGVVVGLPVAAVVLFLLLTRGTHLVVAAAGAALLAHLPVTFFAALVSGTDEERPDEAAVTGVALAHSVGALAMAIGAIGALGGIAARPLAPSERDPLLAEVAAAHRDLNAAVGWDAWRPRALRDTPERLDRAAALSEDAPELVEAADRVRQAVEDDDRDLAVLAHRIVAGFELKVREARRMLGED